MSGQRGKELLVAFFGDYSIDLKSKLKLNRWMKERGEKGLGREKENYVPFREYSHNLVQYV